YSYCHHPHLHSFPTRRSSDLRMAQIPTDGHSDQSQFCSRRSRLLVVTGKPNPRVISLAEAGLGKRPLGLFAKLRHPAWIPVYSRSEEHTSELQSRGHLVCRLL